MAQIKNRVYKTELVEWKKVNDLQPDNLKIPYNYESIKTSIVKYGISKAYDVCEIEGQLYWLDGHTRTQILYELENEGIKIPSQLTGNFIKVKDKAEAIKILLEVHNQRQNPMERGVVIEMLAAYEIEEMEVEIESLNIASEIEEETKVLEAEEDDFDSTPPETPETVLGDLYEIGEHRLLCGDSTDSDAVAKLMNGEKADMVFTYPPYEIDFDYANTLLFSENCHVFIFNNDRAIIRQLQESPLDFKKFFIFHHSGTAIPQEGGNEVFLDHVLVSHEIHGKPKVRYNKGNGTRSVIKGEYRKAEEHKHEKPVSFLCPIIEGYSNERFIILDFFAGGGSMYSISHQLNRKCYGMELDPKYCDVIVKRMIKLDPNLKVKRNGINETQKWVDKI